MSGQTKERAFEVHVEEVLHQHSGWQPGTNAEWNVERALFAARAFAFLEETQPKLWGEMRALHASGLEALVIGALVRELELKGALHILRHGFKFYGKTFRLAYFKPAHSLNEEVLALYAKNQLTITRQVLCHPGKHDTVDLLFAVNGLPVATCELKNPGTGQNWRHAVAQYQKDRDPRAPLFSFKSRALVHFAADPTKYKWRRAYVAWIRISCPSTEAAIQGKSSAAPATRSIRRATARATSGKRCSSVTAFSIFSGTSYLSRRRTRRSTTARGDSGASPERR